MKYGEYAYLAFINLLFTGLAYLLAPVVTLFCKEDGYLPNWLCWFQTFDAPLDAGVRDGYPGFDPAGSRWWNRTKWLWRNPAYGFCYWPLGIPFVASEWTVSCDKQIGIESLFIAHSTDGYFCIMYGGSLGRLKLGWKVSHQWITALDGTRSWSSIPWGPELRSPLAFTPAVLKFWKIRQLFLTTD
jgi:hypothetical protein